MLSLQEIKSFYPIEMRGFDRFMLREYLQFKMLEIIFNSPYSEKLSFLGGTCLRIVHGNNRFSEDLDFDNFNLTIEDFHSISGIIKKELEQQGYKVEMRHVEKGAYHCSVRFLGLLQNSKLSGHKEEKILIQLDTESHYFQYAPEKPILNKFDVFTQINTTPLDILLSQKFYAILNRKQNKGRDFYDIIFLLSMGAIPNYNYLNIKTGIQNFNELRYRINEKCRGLDMQSMGKDVQSFLFNATDVRKVQLFIEYINQVKLV
jgi:predicted nucleotidyltransferase component of viral defense system